MFYFSPLPHIRTFTIKIPPLPAPSINCSVIDKACYTKEDADKSGEGQKSRQKMCHFTYVMIKISTFEAEKNLTTDFFPQKCHSWLYSEETDFYKKTVIFWLEKSEAKEKTSARQTDKHKKRDSMIKKRPEIYYPNIVLCQKNAVCFFYGAS